MSRNTCSVFFVERSCYVEHGLGYGITHSYKGFDIVNRILSLGFGYFVTKSEAQVKENDNHELLDEKSKR